MPELDFKGPTWKVREDRGKWDKGNEGEGTTLKVEERGGVWERGGKVAERKVPPIISHTASFSFQ